MTVNLGQSSFAYQPPEGFKYVIAARKGGVVAVQPKVTAAKEGVDGGGEEGERAPVNLEEFTCATDLADRFGPNRLKVS